MKIAFFEIEDWEKDYLKDQLRSQELVFSKDTLSKENLNLARDAEIISVFIYSRIDNKILNELKNLRAIATRSTGFDHIDLKECRKRKILVLNVPYYGENTVAEHTFALILTLSRKIHKSYERTTRGNFSLEGLRGFDLKGKTIGIVGLGHIGRHVARIAKGFEMKILAFDVKQDKAFSKKFGIKYVGFKKLLKNSDIITLHCPYNKSTHHLINLKNISLIKNGAYLINTARGGNIETRALVSTLAKGNLGGAALDVLEEEAIIKEEIQLLSKNFPKKHLQNLLENHLLLTFDNVIITPHNAFNSQEALQRILDVTVNNLNSIMNKRKSDNIVR
ncbi:hydroxyacid dehydrogenase [Candidatus Pacearchaeota archaeon]|nr:hydroxyacid dehydrogenase [Candidatus Pacearchaeota archaeon]